MSSQPVATREPSRVVTFALDMADGPLIRRWCASGQLPHLAALTAESVWFDLDSPAEVLHTSSWPSFATGTHPGVHGVYYPLQPRVGHQLAQPIDGACGASTFWSRAAAGGRSCIVYDVPETFPEAGFTGNAIFDWGTWAHYGSPTSQPADLLGELEQNFGSYPLGLEAKQLGLRIPGRRALERRLLAAIDHKRDSAAWLLQQGWDLAVIGFSELHPAGHYLWTPEEHDGEGALLRVYQAIDRALGALINALPADVVVLVASGDGLRPNHCGWHLLPEILEGLGYARASEQTVSTAGLLHRLKASVPEGARRAIADHLPRSLRERAGAAAETARLDWSRTRAFALPTDLEGCVRINLRGREPGGSVEQGADYDDLCDAISGDLLQLENAESGAPLVEKVWKRDDVFPGPCTDSLPDLIVSWNDAGPISTVRGPRLPLLRKTSPDRRAGTHSRRGFLVARGIGQDDASPRCGRLVDLGPTVLDALGIEAGPEMEGVSLYR